MRRAVLEAIDTAIAQVSGCGFRLSAFGFSFWGFGRWASGFFGVFWHLLPYFAVASLQCLVLSLLCTLLLARAGFAPLGCDAVRAFNTCSYLHNPYQACTTPSSGVALRRIRRLCRPAWNAQKLKNELRPTLESCVAPKHFRV